MASTVCSTSFSQWKKSCTENTLLDFYYKFLVKKGTVIATLPEDLADLSTLTDLIQSETVIPLPKIVQIDRDDKETEYHEYGSGEKKLKMPAVRRDTNHVLLPLCSTSKLRTLDATEWEVIVMDENGNLAVREVASDDFRGFPINMDINLVDWAMGYTTPIYITYKNSSLFDDAGVVVECDFTAQDVVDAALEEVTLEVVGTPTDTELVVKVYGTCGINSSGVKEFAVTGLVAADFEASSGTVSSVTEVAGTYTFVTSALATGTFGLKAPASMTTSGYKGGNSLAITIT